MRHVNNAVYLTYLEQARYAYWLELTGARRGELPGIILARVECDFKKPLKPGDWVDVWLSTTRIGRSSFTIDYKIVDEDGRVAATARSVQVMYDYAAAKPTAMPEWLRARMEEYEGRTLST